MGLRDSGGVGCDFLFVPGGPGMAKLQVTIAVGRGEVSVSQPLEFSSSPSSMLSRYGSGQGWGSTCDREAFYDCHFAYAIGKEVELSAVAHTEEGWVFGGWGHECVGFGTEQNATLTMDTDKLCMASFTHAVAGAD